MNTENNKIIAEFMGWEVIKDQSNFWVDCNPNIEEAPFQLLNKVFKDWNWLMEVVEKILTVGDDTDQWDNVLNELQTVNKNNAYNACVEFIKWYNEKHNL